MARPSSLNCSELMTRIWIRMAFEDSQPLQFPRSALYGAWSQIVLKNFVTELTIEADIDYGAYLSDILGFQKCR